MLFLSNPSAKSDQFLVLHFDFCWCPTTIYLRVSLCLERWRWNIPKPSRLSPSRAFSKCLPISSSSSRVRFAEMLNLLPWRLRMRLPRTSRDLVRLSCLSGGATKDANPRLSWDERWDDADPEVIDEAGDLYEEEVEAPVLLRDRLPKTDNLLGLWVLARWWWRGRGGLSDIVVEDDIRGNWREMKTLSSSPRGVGVREEVCGRDDGEDKEERGEDEGRMSRKEVIFSTKRIGEVKDQKEALMMVLPRETDQGGKRLVYRYRSTPWFILCRAFRGIVYPGLYDGEHERSKPQLISSIYLDAEGDITQFRVNWSGQWAKEAAVSQQASCTLCLTAGVGLAKTMAERNVAKRKG